MEKWWALPLKTLIKSCKKVLLHFLLMESVFSQTRKNLPGAKDHVLTRHFGCHRDLSEGDLTCKSLHIHWHMSAEKWAERVGWWQTHSEQKRCERLRTPSRPPHITDIGRQCAKGPPLTFLRSGVIPAAPLLMDRTAAVPRQPEILWVKLQLNPPVAGDRFNEHSPATLRHAGALRVIRPEREEGHENEAGDVWLFN